jgi:hypothetical protein
MVTFRNDDQSRLRVWWPCPGDHLDGALLGALMISKRPEQHREDGMTPKNLALIRSVLTEGVWSRVVELPEQLMRQARLHRHSSVRAAVLAQIAVAVAILTVAPVRLGNLAAIRFGENRQPGGRTPNIG